MNPDGQNSSASAEENETLIYMFPLTFFFFFLIQEIAERLETPI